MQEQPHLTPKDILAAPAYRGDRKGPLLELGPLQREILGLQLAEYTQLNEAELHSNLRDRFAGGDTTLPAGTLVHGTSFSPEKAISVAAHGVVSGELFGITENAETHYCADFFRVEEDTTVSDYSRLITEAEPNTGRKLVWRREREYLPCTKSPGEVMGFIIDPTVPEIQGLLEADAYRPGTDELFDGIVNHIPADKNSPKAARLSAVLGGVPHGAIAGIVVSDRLAANGEHMADLVRAFDGQVPVLSVHGQLLNAVAANTVPTP